MLDRFTGCILGLACADALGATLEFMTPEQIQQRYGTLTDIVGGGWLNLPAGDYTDDTQMMRCLLESIVEHGDVVPSDIATRFVAWLESGPRDVGNLTSAAIRNLRRGTTWDEAGKQAWEASGRNAASNGGVMRCAPIGLYRVTDTARLVADAR